MAEKKKRATKKSESVAAVPSPAPSAKRAAPPARKAPPTALAKRLPPSFPRLPPSFSRLPSDDRAPTGTPGDDPKKRLSKQQIDAIRLLALTMAGDDPGPDAVMICNPLGEPPALPLSELLYDKCKWCDVDIYYDRLMPSPPGMMRVCLKCGILLLEADKKGAN